MADRLKKLHSSSTNIRVMYVESDCEEQKNTSSFLSKIFDNLVIAIDGEDGLKKFQDHKIDMIITDIDLPKLNGIEMLKKIKDIDHNCYTIVLLQNYETDTLLQTIQLNVDGYILKPLDFEQLLDAIEKAIEKFKLEHEAKNQKYYLEQYLSLLDKSGVISKTDTEGNITYVNDSFCKISGYKREELIGQKHSITRHHENTNDIYEKMWDSIKTKEEPWEG